MAGLTLLLVLCGATVLLAPLAERAKLPYRRGAVERRHVADALRGGYRCDDDRAFAPWHAGAAHGSGVLALVTIALALSRYGDRESAHTRLVSGTTWDIIELLVTRAAFAFAA